MNETRVLVVGDDVTAWTLACLLARAGVAVECVPRVMGEAEDAGAPRFPLALRFPALEILDGLGLGEHLARQGAHLQRAEIVDRGGRTVSFEGRLPPSISPGTSFDTPLLLDPARLEAALRDRYLALGGRIVDAAMLGAIASDDGGVHVAVTHADGRRETRRFAFVVDATGLLRSWLGVHLEVRHRARYLAACLEPDGEAGVLRSWLGAGEEIAIAMPSAPRAPRIGMAIAAEREPSRAAFVAAFRAASCDSATATPAGPVKLHESIEALAPRFHEGRIFFVGRAAHVHGAPSVHGPNLGIGDAGDVAWRLVRVVAGEAPRDLLDGYGVERRAIADAILRATARKRRLLRAGPGASFSRRQVLLSALEHAYVRERLAGCAIDRDGAGPQRLRLRGSEDATLATRAPDAACVSVPDGAAVTLHETTSGAHFTLLLFGRGTDHALAAAAEGARDALGVAVGVVAVVDEPSRPAPFADWTLHDVRGEARERYGVSAPTAALVRPDGQIAFRGPPDPARLLAHLVANRWVFADASITAQLRPAGS